MAERDRLLSEEELSAIEEAVSSGVLDQEGYNIGLETEKYNLESKDPAGALDTSIIEQISERFRKEIIESLYKELKFEVQVKIEEVKTSTFGEFIKKAHSPSSLNITKMNPLRDQVLVVIGPQVIFSCVDNWFGGEPRALVDLGEDEKEFSSTEQIVEKKLRVGVYAALIEAWSPIFEIQCELLKSETKKKAVNHLPEDEPVVTTSYSFFYEDQELDEIDIVYSYESLKLVRSSLVSAPENEPSLNRLEKLWASQLADSVGAVGFEAVVKAGDVLATVGGLKSLKKGDFLPFENSSSPELFVNGFAIFDVEIGSQGDMTAVKILKSKASEVKP